MQDSTKIYAIFKRYQFEGSFSFEGYRKANGLITNLFRGKDSHGQDNKFIVKWEAGDRDYKVHLDDKELLEYMRNSSDCEGSPNCTTEPYFYEYNEDKIIEAQNKKLQVSADAVTKANELTGAMLLNVSAIYGYMGKIEKKQKNTVLLAAQQDPKGFLDTLTSPDLEARALFIKAEENEVIVLTGVVYMFGQTKLGTSEDDVVALLESDKTVAGAIEKALAKETKPAKK